MHFLHVIFIALVATVAASPIQVEERATAIEKTNNGHDGKKRVTG